MLKRDGALAIVDHRRHLRTGRRHGVKGADDRQGTRSQRHALQSLDRLRQAGAKTGFGTDPLVLDGDPLQDIQLFARPEAIRTIMKAGSIHKNGING